MHPALFPARPRAALCCLCLSLATLAQAQTPADPVVITANPLRSTLLAAPVSALGGDALVLGRGASLGATLDGLPGVSATGFAPHASRPIIRGLDGDRVRMLNNSAATIDASALSFDHAVALEALIATRIEVLRGPGALFYGGSAIGGVVNVLDNRIPAEPQHRVGGAVELRGGGASRERGGAAVIEGGGAAVIERGGAAWAWHGDAYARSHGNLRVPDFVAIDTDGRALGRGGEIRNSAGRARGGALGAAFFVGNARLGLALDRHEARYGVVAEPDIAIDMQRDQLRLEGELKGLQGPLEQLLFKAGTSDYEHREIEGDGSVGTTFGSRGSDWRIEARHQPLGPLRGVLGVQLERFDFSALGEEAFVPGTRTRRSGVFALEELAWAGGSTSAGWRLERARVASDGDAEAEPARFGAPTSRRFALRSASLAHTLPLAPRWNLLATLSRSERAPTYFELYANGVHAATGAYERGDSTLARERGTHAEWALQWAANGDRMRAGVFRTRFDNYIVLQASGERVNEEGEVVEGDAEDGLPFYRFRAVRARLQGFEVEATKTLWRSAWTLVARAQLDATRASQIDTGEPLPRIAPLRARIAFEASQGPWRARLAIVHHERQARVAAGDTPTPGFTMAHLSLQRRLTLGGSDALWFVKLDNATDRLGYNAATIESVRRLAPLPARSLSAGLRVAL